MEGFQPFHRDAGNQRVLRVKNAVIEEISVINRDGYVTISYGIKGDFNMIHIEIIKLIVNQSTIIQEQCGCDLSFRDLREGMIVNAEFSSAMTMSIPPQSNAFRITVIR